jgi:hypothetical protein
MRGTGQAKNKHDPHQSAIASRAAHHSFESYAQSGMQQTQPSDARLEFKASSGPKWNLSL